MPNSFITYSYFFQDKPAAYIHPLYLSSNRTHFLWQSCEPLLHDKAQCTSGLPLPALKGLPCTSAQPSALPHPRVIQLHPLPHDEIYKFFIRLNHIFFNLLDFPFQT